MLFRSTVTTTGGGISVTVASADTSGLAADVARTKTVDEPGMVAGAVYSPPERTVPFAEPPTTDHVTDVLDAPETVALKACEPPSVTVAEDGDTATDTVTVFTCTATVLPVTAPGPGWRTANWMVPAAAAFPVARIFVEDT